MMSLLETLQAIEKAIESGEYKTSIALCQGLLDDDTPLPSEVLKYLVLQSKLFSEFADKDFKYHPSLAYCDTLAVSSHVAITYPTFAFLCSYIMREGAKCNSEGVYLTEQDYNYALEDSFNYMVLQGKDIQPDNALMNVIKPDFSPLRVMEKNAQKSNFCYHNNGFKIENGILVSYSGTENKVVVPEGVVAIGEGAFGFCKAPIIEIVLPETLEEIGDFAFYDNGHDQNHYVGKNLEKINIPASVKRIGKSAFESCRKVDGLDLSHVEEIDDDAFKWNYGITYADLKSLKKLGSSVFWTASSLKTVVNFEYNGALPPQCFRSCRSLENFTMPKGVTELTGLCFSDCHKLPSLDISNIVKFSSYDLSDLSSVDHFDLNENVTEIPYKLFSGCCSMKEIRLPEKITSIQSNAFYNCAWLERITLPNITEISEGLFSYCKNLKEIIIPDTVENIGEQAFYECKSLEKVVFPSKLKKISKSAFFGCDNLKQVILSSVDEIEKEAFKGCINLETLKIDKVKKLGALCFNGCKKLTQVDLMSSAEIHAKSFSGLSKLKINFI